MNRADWQQIAEERLLAADVLLAANRWASAYYLAGYAVECGLKSCVLARLTVDPKIVFTEKKFDCKIHNLEKLLELADLEVARAADIAVNQALGQNWLIAKDWTEQSRYKVETQVQWQTDAQKLCGAIADNANGVMQWIRTHW